MKTYDDLVEEVQALAAHVEAGKRITKVGEYAKWCATAPATSLDRLKAEWQAEVLSFLESRIRPLEQRDNGAKGKGYNLALGDCLAAIDMVQANLSIPGLPEALRKAQKAEQEGGDP